MSDIKGITVDNISRKEWSEFVSSHPYGNIFQTPEMYEVYEGTKNYEPLFVGAVDGRGTILGVLVSVVQKEFGGPLGSLTSRCVTWGGPLVKANKNEMKRVMDFILSEQKRIAKKKAIYMQFRNLWDMSEYNEIFGKNGYEYEEHLNILIDLTKSEDELWGDLKKDRRRGIRRAIRMGHSFSELGEDEDIGGIYKAIEETYDNVKVPLADISLFTSARRIMGPKGMVRFFKVENDDEVLAVRVNFTFHNMLYDWYAGSSINGKKARANDFIVWKILLWGHNNGFSTFDFGGAGKPNEPYGPREFKREFGGRFVNYGRYQNVFKKTKMKIAMAGLKAMKKVK